MKKKEFNLTKKDAELVRKAIAVSADQGDSDVSAYLPTPLALQVIEYIREINIMRRILTVFNMPARTWTKPKRASGQSAYYIPDGVKATESGFVSTSLQWVAKKLMAFTTVDEEAVEDSQPDLMSQILKDFSDAVAEAEEYALLQGDPSHTATAPTPDAATANNWYNKDARLAFKGMFTLAGEADAADSIDAASGAFDPDMVNKALYNLGKYGRVKRNVIGIVPTEQATNIRGNSNWASAAVSGLPLAAFITGLGSAGEGDGLVTQVFGVNFYEAPLAPSGKALMFLRTSPALGDRRRIKFASGESIEQDQRKFVVSERIAFNVDYQDALVLIDSLSTTLVS